MLSATNPIDEVASFDWDDAGRMLRATRPDLEVTSFADDDNGNLEALTPPGRAAHQIDSDPRDLIASYTPPAVAGTGEHAPHVVRRSSAPGLQQVPRTVGSEEARMLRAAVWPRAKLWS